MARKNDTTFRGDGDVVIVDIQAASGFQEVFTVSTLQETTANSANGLYWTFSTPKRNYHVWYNQPGKDGNPLDPGRPIVEGGLALPSIGVPVTVASATPSSTLVINTVAALNRLGEIHASVINNSTLQVSVLDYGVATDAADGTMGITATVDTQGVNRSTMDVDWVVGCSGGGIGDLITEAGSVFDVHGSTYELRSLNSFPIDGSGLVGAGADQSTKSDNRTLSAADLDSRGSHLGAAFNTRP